MSNAAMRSSEATSAPGASVNQALTYCSKRSKTFGMNPDSLIAVQYGSGSADSSCCFCLSKIACTGDVARNVLYRASASERTAWGVVVDAAGWKSNKRDRVSHDQEVSVSVTSVHDSISRPCGV